MSLDKKDEQYLDRVRKHQKRRLWPSTGALFYAAWVGIFHKDKFGLEGLITIEILIGLLILIFILQEKRERRLMDIIEKLTKL